MTDFLDRLISRGLGDPPEAAPRQLLDRSVPPDAPAPQPLSVPDASFTAAFQREATDQEFQAPPAAPAGAEGALPGTAPTQPRHGEPLRADVAAAPQPAGRSTDAPPQAPGAAGVDGAPIAPCATALEPDSTRSTIAEAPEEHQAHSIRTEAAATDSVAPTDQTAEQRNRAGPAADRGPRIRAADRPAPIRPGEPLPAPEIGQARTGTASQPTAKPSEQHLSHPEPPAPAVADIASVMTESQEREATTAAPRPSVTSAPARTDLRAEPPRTGGTRRVAGRDPGVAPAVARPPVGADHLAAAPSTRASAGPTHARDAPAPLVPNTEPETERTAQPPAAVPHAPRASFALSDRGADASAAQSAPPPGTQLRVPDIGTPPAALVHGRIEEPKEASAAAATRMREADAAGVASVGAPIGTDPVTADRSAAPIVRARLAQTADQPGHAGQQMAVSSEVGPGSRPVARDARIPQESAIGDAGMAAPAHSIAVDATKSSPPTEPQRIARRHPRPAPSAHIDGAGAAAAPPIDIVIDRIDVVVAPPPAPPSKTPRRPPLSLKDYLRRRPR
jgi:hypothetical protein